LVEALDIDEGAKAATPETAAKRERAGTHFILLLEEVCR